MVKLCDLLVEFGLDFNVDEIILTQNASWWPILMAQNAENLLRYLQGYHLVCQK